ncbi:MAG: hypothetical protein GEU78_11180 [Actinobacteria bacterium]|nr:hypothetical protein [Actinomycetota bacterium]
MSADISRMRFDPLRDHAGVVLQQGRLLLDADFNELGALLDRRFRAETTDLTSLGPDPGHAGAAWVPRQTPDAFRVTLSGGELSIGRGRMYVDGLLAENHGAPPYGFDPLLSERTGTTDTPYGQQPYWRTPDPLPTGGPHLAYLDVWQREVTHLEDPNLVEPAIGVDTAARWQTVWQVRLLPEVGDITCATEDDDFPNWLDVIAPSAGRLTTDTVEVDVEDDQCELPPTGGYRGLENQTYRVEIHTGGAPGSATFKWSRDNASVVMPVVEMVSPTVLRLASLGRDDVLRVATGDWVEIVDDHYEFDQRPGEIRKVTVDEAARTITFSGAIPTDLRPADPQDASARHLRVRRWDQAGVVRSGAGAQLVNLDAPGSTGVINVPAGETTQVVLEHGVVVSFSLAAGGGEFHAGDHWIFAARTEDTSVELLEAAPPLGIHHHYARLGIVTLPDSETDCRRLVPDLPPHADDLDHHNKHLHGWGIVCGLKVVCGPDDDGVRDRVTVKEGYALDCEGRGIFVDSGEELDVLGRISRSDELQKAIDEDGDGEVCIMLERDSDGKPSFSLEPYDPSKDTLQSLLSGTLLMDFYLDCIAPLEQFFRDELTPSEEEQDLPAGPVEQRVAALTNLLAQPINPKSGQNIFLSEREHKILFEFYNKLRALLKSQTFCAMFATARPFPDYPFSDLGLDTIFAKNRHLRIRSRPNSPEAYSVGPGFNPKGPATLINRYDIEANLLVGQIDPIAGMQTADKVADSGAGAVQDVAFSLDGKSIYTVIPTRAGENSFFRAGRVTEQDVDWDSIVTVCGVKFVSLAVVPTDRDHVYAIGMDGKSTTLTGLGLYRIDPSNVDPNMQPIASFNACGHLVAGADGRVFATAAGEGEDASSYDRVVVIEAPEGNAVGEISLEGRGQDDIAVQSTKEGAPSDALFTVTGVGADDRTLFVHDPFSADVLAQANLPSTTVRLQTVPAAGALTYSSEDGYLLGLMDTGEFVHVAEWMLPTQVGPIALARQEDLEKILVLNYLSNTVSVVDQDLFRPDFEFDFDALHTYRKEAIEAYTDLLAGLLQYLKDCLCDHLLVECPECNGDETIYLGCVSIRSNQVHKVCNFSRRKYVKSFPTVGYWLSAIPIYPMLTALVERFCCLVLPDIFARYQVSDSPEEDHVRTSMLQGWVSSAHDFDIASKIGDLLARTRGVRNVALGAASAPSPAIAPATRVRPAEIVEQPVSTAIDVLEAKDVRVETKTVGDTPRGDLRALATGLISPAPGSTVTLYEDDQVVRFYTVEPPGIDTRVESLASELQTARDDIGKRDDQLSKLRSEVASLKKRQGELEKAPGRLDELVREVEELRTLNQEMRRFLDNQ